MGMLYIGRGQRPDDDGQQRGGYGRDDYVSDCLNFSFHLTSAPYIS